MKSILLLSLVILFGYGCDGSGQNESPYPEAVKQDIDGKALELAYFNARQIAHLQGLAVSRNGVIVAEEYFNNASSLPDSNLHECL